MSVATNACSKAVSLAEPGLSTTTRRVSDPSGASSASDSVIAWKNPRSRASGVRRCSPAITRLVMRRFAIA